MAAPYTFSFFNEEQKETLRLMMARIIPADERSPGAVGAKVDEYIDFILIHADPQVQQTWKLGLARYRAATAGKSAGRSRFLSREAGGSRVWAYKRGRDVFCDLEGCADRGLLHLRGGHQSGAWL